MKFGVVIVTYNRLNLLKECIECVLNQTVTVDYISVINNASTDGTGEYLDAIEAEHDTVHVIHSDANLGGAGGFALGIRETYSKVDYLLIIDDDAMLSPNYLGSIKENMVDDILAYSGRVTTDGVIDTSHRRVMKNKVLMIKEDVPADLYKEEYFDYELATFCGLMVATSIIKEIGFPREDFFIWYDDTEYSLLIGRYSKIRNVNSATINHKTKLTVDSNLTWKSYYGYRNATYVGVEYSRNKALYKCFRHLFFVARIIQYRAKLVFAKNSKDYYKYCIEMYKDVLRDVKNNVVGKNGKYLPG